MDGSSCSRTNASIQDTNGCRSGDEDNKKFPWDEANKHCVSEGKRLCNSQEELDPCCSTGCSYDFQLVWTGTIEGRIITCLHNKGLNVTYQNKPNDIHCIGKHISGTCTPYSESACRMAAEKAGLELGGGGYPFAGYVVNKGCYTYATGTYKGFAFYGLGGDSKTNSELFDVTKKYYRPEGYDCSSSNFCTK